VAEIDLTITKIAKVEEGGPFYATKLVGPWFNFIKWINLSQAFVCASDSP